MPALNPPDISVVVNNYNYANFLEEALDSAIRQLHSNDELIVVDDGSTDHSPDLLQTYSGKDQVRIIAQQNQGQMTTVRTGVKAATGDIVVLLDSDDYLLPGYLDKLRQIYRENDDIDFVFTAAIVDGQNPQGVKNNRENLARMAMPAGRIGPTRWATQLFYEYVGVPTSGISMRTELANRIATLPGSLDKMRAFSPLLVKLLRIPEKEVKNPGPSADGVFIRVSSLLDAQKYYNDTPGFMYRIHGSNKFAGISRIARMYLRARRMKYLIALAVAHFELAHRPGAVELRQEILERAYGLRLRRRISIRTKYMRCIANSNGSLTEKLMAVKAALFGK